MDVNTGPSCGETTGTYMALGSSSGPEVIMALGCSTGYPDEHSTASCSMVLGHQHDLRRQARPWASLWPLVIIRTKDINSDPGYSRTMNSDIALSCSWFPSTTMAQGVSAGHSDWQGPHGGTVLRYLHSHK